MQVSCAVHGTKSHMYCQDYAIAENLGNNTYVLGVFDGCSSGENTQVGSAILANVILGNLYRKFDHYFESSPVRLLDDSFKEINLAYSFLEKFMDSSMFFSTALLVLVRNDQMKFINMGDGFLIIETDTNKILHSMQFSENLPYYPAYSYLATLDNLEVSWLNEKENKYGETCTDIEEEIVKKILTGGPIEYLKETYNWQEIPGPVKKLYISTDGLESFLTSPVLLAKSLLDIKSTQGEFMKRRLNKVLHELALKQDHNKDDIAIAGLINE